MASPCIECGDIVEPTRGSDGHFRKKCDCGHIGGPYISNQNSKTKSGQMGLDDF